MKNLGMTASGEEDMILKTILSIFAAVLGFWILFPVYGLEISAAIGLGAGALVFLVSWVLDYELKKLQPRSLLGLSLGIAVASLAYFAFNSLVQYVFEAQNIPVDGPIFKLISSLLFITLFYMGVKIGVSKGAEVDRLAKAEQGYGGETSAKILDTSVIIDGRIADVAEVGFIDGVIIIPKFVIKELQYIADSPDPIKRVRGRRGLDVLKHMQEEIPGVAIQITDQDFPNIREVDLKLVDLAKQIGGIVITNDFNLNKVAGLEGVKVLNLNQLANALKPVVLPGETMNIHVVKEGKEENQGVGYLEDGTMIVVDNAKKFIGKDVEVSVTSVLQTPTGRMIFTKVKGQRMSADYY